MGKPKSRAAGAEKTVLGGSEDFPEEVTFAPVLQGRIGLEKPQ